MWVLSCLCVCVVVCGWMRLALRVMPQGYPVYGPFGYEGPVDTGSGVVRIRSSYVLKVRVRVSDCGVVPGAWCLVCCGLRAGAWCAVAVGVGACGARRGW